VSVDLPISLHTRFKVVCASARTRSSMALRIMSAMFSWFAALEEAA
jgi:hypothetical protein